MTFTVARIQAKWTDAMFSQFEGAELLAQKHGLEREEFDLFDYKSQLKAFNASQAKKFNKDLVPIKELKKQGNEIIHKTDEGIRSNVSLGELTH